MPETDRFSRLPPVRNQLAVHESAMMPAGRVVFCARSARCRNTPREKDYMAVLAVCCEPVSRANSLLTGKITGNSRDLDRFFDARMGKRRVIPATYIEIP